MKRLTALLIFVIVGVFSLAANLAADDSRTVEQTFAVKPGERLFLDLETGGEINIEGWDKEEISLIADIGGDDADLVEIEFDETKGGLTVHSFFAHKHRHTSVDIEFEIKVPRRFDVEFDTKGGGIWVTGVEGELSGETMGGELELSRVKGEVDLKTMGGEVKVEDSDLDGEVSTMGGDVIVRNVSGGLKANTMGGSITYDNNEPAAGTTGKAGTKGAGATKRDLVQVETKGGDIEVNTAAERIDAKTLGGDVKIAKADVVHVSTLGGDIDVGEAPAGADLSTMGGDITLVSAGGHVEAGTMGGDIILESVDGSVDAHTMGGDIDVRIVGDPKKGAKDAKLESMGGDINLVVPDGLGMEFDIEIEVTKHHHGKCRIESDFAGMKIDASEKWQRRGLFGEPRKHIYGTGTMGDGSNLIKIKTVNGSVFIRKAGS